MKFNYPLGILFLFSIPAWAVETSQPLFMEEAFFAALRQVETPRIQALRSEQAEERYSQAKGGFLPRLSAIGTYLRQQEADGGSSSSSAFREPDQYSAKITLSQPLFRGLAEFGGLSQRRLGFQAQQAAEEQARVDLFGQVARTYYGVLAAEQDLKNLKELQELTEQRVAELRRRVSIGRSRQGELLSAQAQVSVLSAQIRAAEAQLQLSRDRFALVTGLDPKASLARVTPDRARLPELSEPVQVFLDRLDKRPDLASLQAQVEASEEGIGIARAGHLPAVDLSGNYYIRRTGVLEGSKWDLGVTLTLPIFSGGIVSSQVREAGLIYREQELVLSQARRTARTQVLEAYEAYASGFKQFKALSEALQVSERNYLQQLRDYRLGLVPHLEVLASLNMFQESKRALDRTYYLNWINWSSLKAAVGERPKAQVSTQGS